MLDCLSKEHAAEKCKTAQIFSTDNPARQTLSDTEEGQANLVESLKSNYELISPKSWIMPGT